MKPEADYEVLGLRPGASAVEAWQSYRRLVEIWHPERFAGDRYLEGLSRCRLGELREAYGRVAAVLGPPARAASQPDPALEALRSRHWYARLTVAGAIRAALWWIILVAGIYVATS